MTSTPELSKPPSQQGASAGGAPDPAMRATFEALHVACNRLRKRVRRGILVEGLAIIAMGLALYFVLTWPADRFLRLETPVRAMLVLLLVGLLTWRLVQRCVRPLLFDLDDEELALAVERTNAPLGQRLISAMQFERRVATGKARGDSMDLMHEVVRGLPAALASVRFPDALRKDRIAKSWLIALCGIGFLATVASLYPGFGLWARRNLLLSSTEWPRATQLVVVGATNNEVVVPRGDDLTIEVDAEGVVPETLRVSYSFESGTRGSDAMTQNVGERRFRYTFPGVLEAMRFEAFGGDGVTGEIRVRLVDRPQLSEEAYTLEFPAYMKKGAVAVGADETQVTVPRGTKVTVTGVASKPLTRAELAVSDKERAPLTIGTDRRRVDGSILPEDSGLLRVEMIDEDGLGQGPGRSLIVRVVPDKAPILRTRLRGLGSMITPKARIGIELEALDDFGLETLRLLWAVDESAAIGTSAALEGKFQASETSDLDRFEAGSTLFEGMVRHDLLPLVVKPDDLSAPENPIRPGSFVALRFVASDNDHSEDASGASGKQARSDSFTFKVVTEAELLRELNRRQGELRMQFEKILEAETADRAEFAELESPKAEGELGMRVQARLATLARKQRSLSKRVLETGLRYGEVLDEMINNRVADGIGGEGRVRALRTAIVDRLDVLGKSAMPALAGEIARFQRSGAPADQKSATDTFDEVLRTMRRVLAEMMKLESFTEILTQLKDVIRIGNQAAELTKKRLQADLDSLFGGGREDSRERDKD